MFSETKQYDRPSILVVAGPNGSGKSTVTKGLPVIGLYVNADEIKKASKCSDLEAAQEAEMIRRALQSSSPGRGEKSRVSNLCCICTYKGQCHQCPACSGPGKDGRTRCTER